MVDGKSAISQTENNRPPNAVSATLFVAARQQTRYATDW
jgi:hypothetical protein